MRTALNQKFVNVTPPAAIVDNASFTTAELDTLGFRFVTYLIVLGATDIAVAALKLTESDTAGSGHADVDGTDYSTDGTLPSATDDNKIFAIHVDLRGRKRYLDLTFTAGDGTAGTFGTVIAVLSDPEIMRSSATDRGLAAELAV
jgi:hypothetical protein